MIEAVIFDFDGVIAESVDIKTDAFRELFRDHPKHLEALIAYHLHHGGVSRVEKIKYFYNEVLKQPLSQIDLDALCRQFSALVVEKVIAAPFVGGAEELLNWGKGRFDMFVVSGTPQEEIAEVIDRRRLSEYFREVLGSPRTKKEIVRDILDRHDYNSGNIIMIGDAITDLEAAKDNQIFFIARETKESGAWIDDAYVKARFSDLCGVKALIEQQAGELWKA